MAKLKDLYIAKTMKELNEKSSADFEKGKSMKYYLNMVNKLYQAAENAFSNKDEERSYILYMRYVDAMMKIRKTKDFQNQREHYNNLFGNAKLQAAVNKAEGLSETLKKRYDKLVTNKIAEKNCTKNDSVANANEENPLTSTEFKFPSNSVTSKELHKLLFKDKKQIILMDIRSIEDYQDSHIIHSASINVPKTVILPGSVTSKIQAGIPLDHMKIWNSRDSVDLVVIFDWHSTIKRLQDKSDPLRSLKDSIFKWEQLKQLSREPVILEGGYADWLETYPQFTSNPQVNPPDNKPKTSNVNSLLNFDYADLRKTFISTNDHHFETAVANDIDKPIINGVSSSHPESKMKKEMRETNNLKANSSSAPESNHISSIPSLYPSIDSNIKIKKQPGKATCNSPTNEHQVSSVPVFDRSVKPKLSPSSSSSTLHSESSSNISINKTLSSPMKVDRSVKPKLSVEKNHNDIHDQKAINQNQSDSLSETDKFELNTLKIQSNKEEKLVVHTASEKKTVSSVQNPIEYVTNKKDLEISDAKSKEIVQLEQNILNMKKDQEERKKRVLELEEKKRLELLSIQQQMKLNSEKLAERELKAQNDLAATMRRNKPKGDDNVSNTYNGEISSHIDPAAKRPDVFVSSKSKDLKLSDTTLKNTAVTTTKKDSSITETSTNNHVNSTAGDAGPLKKINQPTNLPIKPKPDLPKSSPIVSPSHGSSIIRSLNSPNQEMSTSDVPSGSKINEPRSSVYQAPLKDESSGQSVGLKRSFSSPNIAKMVQPQVGVQQIPSVPSRQNKPTPIVKPSPNRSTKAISQDETDPVLSNLNLSLRGVYGGEGRAKCGLRNLGNSCYMNSILQCMFNTTHLAEYILNNNYKQDINRNKNGYGGRVVESFAVLLRAIWSGQYRYLIPSDMKQIAGTLHDSFATSNQEDSHEFLLFLLDGLNEDLNRATDFKYKVEPDNNHLSDDKAAQDAWENYKKRNQSIIVELFTGMYKSTLTCLHCKKSSRKFEIFRFHTLSLPSHSSSLMELLRDFSKNEKLTGDERWNCPSCKVHREAVKSIVIWKLPPILVIHLKRFVWSGRWRDKIHTHVSFPTSGLDLTEYTCGSHKRNKYDLYAVSHHHGAGLDSGHYTASCRSAEENRWYKFDDTEVSSCSSPHTSSAFILFYSSYPRKPPIASF